MRWRFVILGLLLLASAAGADSGSAGTGTYPSPLYLSGTASTLLGASNTFVSSVGPGQPATAPTAVAGAAGGLSGSYSYAYTIVDATGGETAASPTSSTVTVASKVITVLGLPTGVTVRLYRAKTGLLERVAELPANASATYTDATDDATADTNAVILPQAQNRIPLNTTGYQDFSPGVYAPLTATTTVAGAASTTPSGKGWIADGSGSVNFPTGTWTYAVKLKQNASFGVARLVVGMWKVAVSGGVITSSTLLVDPTCATAPCSSGAPPGENTTSFTTASGTKTINHAVTVSTFSLASNEHLYVQFWRHETTGMIGGSAANELATLYGYDGTTQITHPAANGFPNAPALSSVAARINTTPALSATFSDPDAGDTGTLSFQLCADSGCATVLQSGTTSSVANGASGTWTPSALADGTYYWRARAQDSAGNQSDSWSAVSTFTVDTVAPSVPTLIAPAAGARVASPQLTATFSDSDPADSGTLSFQLCSDATCSSVVANSTSATLANGANASWTPGVPDGIYRWRVRAQDAAGNLSAWSAIQTFTLDTAPPSPTTLDAPADGAALNALPSLGATFVDSDATDTGAVWFQICSDAPCTNVVASGNSATLSGGGHGTWTPSSLPDGTYYARVRNQDIAGNASAWSTPTRSFTLDRTVPAIPTLSGIADGTRTASVPTLGASFSDSSGSAGTVTFQLCTTSSCGGILQTGVVSGVANGATGTWTPSALAEGTYYWRARAKDAAGNQSAWSAAIAFTVDVTAPHTPTGLAPAAAARIASPQLTASFSDIDPADSGTLSFQVCSDATCSSVVANNTSATLANGANASWTPGIPDGIYRWRVRAQDAAGNLSAWSTIRTFTLDTASPSPTRLDTPADGAALSALPSLGATFVDSDATDTGAVSFQICTDAPCTNVVASGNSATLSGGGHGTWTPSSLPDGTYYARVRNQDIAGNASAWSSPAGSFSVDTAPPTVPTTSGIGDGVRTPHQPTLAATFANPGGTGTGSVTIELCASSNCGSILQSATENGIADGATGTWTPDFLSDGTYYWRARAQDDAGNHSAWSSPTAFTIDTTPPRAPTVSTARGRFSSAPLLTADASSDTARGVIQLCTDQACSVVRNIGVAGRAGAGIAWQAPSLPDGTYYWRAFAEDGVGNDSGWSTTGSFVIDTVPPDVPTLGGPAADARVSQLDLSGTFASLDTGDTGKIAFQICTDAACASPVTTWWSADTAPGVPARWSPPGLADGTYFWRLAAEDAAGNGSAWSDTRRLTLDTTPPAQPNALRATLSKQILALRWKLPTSGDQVSGYALFVNGKRTRTLQVGLLAVEIPLRAHDRRTFAIAAVDTAGNVGARSRAVAVMPQLVNLTLQQAKAETDARKLVLRWSKKTAPSTTRVVAQNQAALSVVDVGSAVTVVVASEPAHRTKS